MGNKSQQDAYVDDAEDTCPLCVEEFDLSDRNFRPCPCGYQVCQFCYNNIRSNMNGLCPACRRPYDDKTIEWKVVSPEEFKADVAAQARRKAAARQKEAERKQVETLNKKHLAGLRVLQKNLVYVVGMDISGDDHALETLRGPNHFGQYGDIIKIVASKAKEGYAGHQSTGIYVTFAKKEDAATCIAAVDGTAHEDRVLRAQYGTTKYCSSFLRNERCTNRNCMFLHETGDDSDSFSRQDLSSFNAASSQRSAPTATAPTSRITHQSQAPTSSPAPAPAIAAQTIKAEAMSRSDSGGEGPALPTTATWAKNPQIEQSRRSSQAPSRATPSPKPTSTKLAPPQPDSRAVKMTVESKSKSKKAVATNPPAPTEPTSPSDPNDPHVIMMAAIKSLAETDFSWKLDRKAFDVSTLAIIDNHPPLFNLNQGILQIMKRKEEEARNSAKAKNSEAPTGLADDGGPFDGGSLQLGGEPEHVDEFLGQRNSRGQTPFGTFGDGTSFNGQSQLGDEFASLTVGGRSLTPQQQRNISLLKSGTLSTELPTEQRGGSGNQHHSQLSNPFQAQNQQLNALTRHGRQTSRFTFSPESSTGSGSIKPSANSQALSQMTQNPQKGFGNTQPGMQSAFYSGVQGPPPGLKASGTPPISGGGMFGQGHGFGNAMGAAGIFGNNIGKGNEENTRDLLRNRPGGEANKLDITDPSILQARMQHPTPAAQGLYSGTQSQDFSKFDQPRADTSRLPRVAGLRELSTLGITSKPPGLGTIEFPPLVSSLKPSSADSPKIVVPVIPLPTRTSTSQSNPTAETAPEAKRASSSFDPKPTQARSEAFESATNPAPQSTIAAIAKPPKLSTTSTHHASTPSASSAGEEVKAVTHVEIASVKQVPQRSHILASKPEKPETVFPQSVSEIAEQGNIRVETEKQTNTQESAPQPPARGPRTLRLLTALKNETPQSLHAENESSSVLTEQSSMKSALQSSGTASAKQPSTPINELMSDNVSLTSASASRPGTPGLSSRMHTGPSNVKSKNQVKKERQARAKQMEESRSEEASIADDTIQAPVIGRKKKTKKVSTAKVKGIVRGTSIDMAANNIAALGTNESAPKTANTEPTAEEESRTTQRDLTEVSQSPPKPAVTGSTILAHLKDEAIITVADLELFANPVGLNTKHAITSNIFKYGIKSNLDEDEKDFLDRGGSIAKQINPEEWAVVLPDRSVLRHFTEDEAHHYADLKLQVDQNSVDTFNGIDFPIEAWSNFTSNDVLSNLQIAPPFDSNPNDQPYSVFDNAGPLIDEFTATLLRPDVKDVSYAATYPPRTQAENEEIEARMAMYTLQEAEQTVKASEELLSTARKETEQLEKKVNALVKKNRKILKDWL